jgi:hypothetical protein
VDKPPSPQTERIAPDPPKPSSPKGVCGSPGAGGAPTSPTRAAPGQDPAGTSSGPEPVESPRASSPSPQSYGLGAAGGSQYGEGLSVPQSEEPSQQHSWVVESLWDNPDLMRARFHIGLFVTVAVDTKAD